MNSNTDSRYAWCYGDDRTAAEIAADQITSARNLPDADHEALDREAARRGVAA